MRKPKFTIRRSALPVRVTVLICLLAAVAIAQPTADAPKRTIFLDHEGREITNDEFVDIRVANFHYPDRTLIRTLEDGTTEFRLQRVPQEGMQAPDVVFQTVDGSRIAISELRGKVVVLNFWFIGCPVCLAYKPKLNELRSKFAANDNVVFLAATADAAGDVRKFLAKEKFDYIQAVDADAALKQFVFSGYPKNIVVSKTGEIVYWRSTIAAWTKFEKVINEELAK